MCGPASSSWEHMRHPSYPGLSTSRRSWAGLSWLDRGIFLMGHVCGMCHVLEVNVCQLKLSEVPLLALSWRVAFDRDAAKGSLQMRVFPKLWRG